MNPHDKNDCPICEAEISGRVLISNRIKQREEFYCPGCKSVLTYSVIKKQHCTEILLHHAGDPKKLYGDDAQDIGDYIGKKSPINLIKPVEVMSAKAYLTKEMETKSGKILPDGSLVTILNVNKKGDNTEVVFEDSDLSSLPTVSVPKRNLLLSGEEIEMGLSLRLTSPMGPIINDDQGVRLTSVNASV